jgi:hypothetical protein
MTVPLWAALLSLFVACVPPLQATLVEVEPLVSCVTIFTSELCRRTHLLPQNHSALKSAGSCSVPVTLITLGAYFFSPVIPSPTAILPPKSFLSRFNLFAKLESPADLEERREEAERVRERQKKEHVVGETRTIVVAVISRMIIVPLILLPVSSSPICCLRAYTLDNRYDFHLPSCLAGMPLLQ